MKIGLTYHICHEILRQIVPKNPVAPTSFWAKSGKTLKQIENFDQNVHVSNFSGKQMFALKVGLCWSAEDTLLKNIQWSFPAILSNTAEPVVPLRQIFPSHLMENQ
jgi:hypothetical protein